MKKLISPKQKLLLFALFCALNPIFIQAHTPNEAVSIGQYTDGVTIQVMAFQINQFTVELKEEILTMDGVYTIRFEEITGTNDELVNIYTSKTFDQEYLLQTLNKLSVNYTLLSTEYLSNVDLEYFQN